MTEIVSEKLPWEAENDDSKSFTSETLPWEQEAIDNIDRNTPTAEETEDEKLGFFDGLGFSGDESAGDKFKKIATEDSFVGRLGGILAEKAVGTDSPLVQDAKRAEIYEKWQKPIWDAEDAMNSIPDRNSPEYQQAFEDLQNVKRNFVDDLAGNYTPEEESEPFDFGQFWDTVKDNKGFMLGAIARGLIADPELMLIPGGWTKTGHAALRAAQAANIAGKTGKAATAVRVAGEVAGAFTLGAGLGASAELIQQVDEDPDGPINYDRVLNTSLVAGGIAGVLPIGNAAMRSVAGKVGEVMDSRSIKSVEKRAQQIWQKAVKEDGTPQLTKQAAINRAIAEVKPSERAQGAMRSLDEFMSEDVMRFRAAEEAAKTGIVHRTKDGIVNGWHGTVKAWDDLTLPLTTRIRNMGLPHLAGKLNEHDMNLSTELSLKQMIREEFSDQFSNLDEARQIIAAQHMANGTFSSVADTMPDGFKKSFTKVREMLDKELIDANNVGIDIPGVENYFPRQMNYIKFAADNGIDTAQTNAAMAKAINAKLNLPKGSQLAAKDITKDLVKTHLSDSDISHALSTEILRKSGGAGVSPMVSSIKSRTIQEISPEQMIYYSDPRVALNDHINRMTIKIHDRAFFGGKRIDLESQVKFNGKPDEETMMMGYIRDHAARLAENKEILPEDMDEIVRLLRARFVGGKQRANQFNAGAKNLMYAATLGNPVSAATQLGDMGAAAYLNGYDQAINSVIQRGLRGTKFKMHDFGLDTIPEIESMGATNKILDWSLRAGGFKAMDRIGKEAILNATYTKLQSVAKKAVNKNGTVNVVGRAKALAEFKARFGHRLGNSEVEKILDGVLTGDTKNHYTRLALYSDLTKVQPISMSEMPVAYLNNPNMRIFFMLKTFTLKQIDLMRADVLNEITAGAKAGDIKQVGKGVYNMAKLAGTIGAANMGVDAAKRWMVGEEVELGDAVVSTVLRNYGVSQYTLNELTKGNVDQFVLKTVVPPVGVFLNPVKEGLNQIDDSWGLDTKGRWIDTIPWGRGIRFLDKADVIDAGLNE